jgi:hypothetical protein
MSRLLHFAAHLSISVKEQIVSFQKSSITTIAAAAILTLLSVSGLMAQNTTPAKITVTDRAPKPVAAGNNLYCAGYIQSSAISTANYIIGGKDEADHFNYSQNDFVFINMGRDKGVNVGDTFAIVRPRGAVKSKWSRKNDIGFYVQEVGAVEVVRVKQDVSVARIKTSCDSFLLGDLVQLVEKRTSPISTMQPAMDLFGDPSGKATGRILMSRDGAEMLTRDYVAYVDLGADDNIRIGDRLTIFRPLAKGNITRSNERESISSRDYGYQSRIYQGGKFSNQSSRKSGDKAGGREVRTLDVRSSRPQDLRKVVGEAVVLNVKEKTATVVIVRTGQEIHTGDWVEIQ